MFRAWSEERGDGRYFKSDSGSPVISVRVKEGKLCLMFLCVTEEISE